MDPESKGLYWENQETGERTKVGDPKPMAKKDMLTQMGNIGQGVVLVIVLGFLLKGWIPKS